MVQDGGAAVDRIERAADQRYIAADCAKIGQFFIVHDQAGDPSQGKDDDQHDAKSGARNISIRFRQHGTEEWTTPVIHVDSFCNCGTAGDTNSTLPRPVRDDWKARRSMPTCRCPLASWQSATT